MTQQTLTPGPGSPITLHTTHDFVLLVSAAITADEATTAGSGYVQVDRPGLVTAVLTTGAIGASAVMDVEVWGADDTSGTNPVMYGRFNNLVTGDADSEFTLEANVYKPYMAVLLDYSGSGSVVAGVTVETPCMNKSETRTA